MQRGDLGAISWSLLWQLTACLRFRQAAAHRPHGRGAAGDHRSCMPGLVPCTKAMLRACYGAILPCPGSALGAGQVGERCIVMSPS